MPESAENKVCRFARYRNGPFRTHANGFYGRGKTLSKENQKAIIINVARLLTSFAVVRTSRAKNKKSRFGVMPFGRVAFQSICETASQTPCRVRCVVLSGRYAPSV